MVKFRVVTHFVSVIIEWSDIHSCYVRRTVIRRKDDDQTIGQVFQDAGMIASSVNTDSVWVYVMSVARTVSLLGNVYGEACFDHGNCPKMINDNLHLFAREHFLSWESRQQVTDVAK